MPRSTRRTSLPRAAATLIALCLAVGWAQSGPVLAHSTAEAGGGAAGAPILADPRFETVDDAAAATTFTSPLELRERREAALALAITKVKQAPASKPVVASKPATTSRPTYSGPHRFWIPSLGMNYRVHLYECSRNRPPDNFMYRWGCAGTNNVYILGHAYSVMQPLHDLYVAGRLKRGMVAVYADGQGRVHWFKVTEWRVVDPVESAWAIADQPVPSMTLQTCVGKDGRYRLNVRLVQYKVT